MPIISSPSNKIKKNIKAEIVIKLTPSANIKAKKGILILGKINRPCIILNLCSVFIISHYSCFVNPHIVKKVNIALKNAPQYIVIKARAQTALAVFFTF